MVRTLSLRISKFIHAHNPQSSSVEVLQYAVSIFLNSVLVVAFVLGIALATQHLEEALAVFGAFAVLRYFSGGLHLQSSTFCNALSALTFVGLTHMPAFPAPLTVTFTALAFLNVTLHAPRSAAKNNFAEKKYKMHLKVCAMAIVASNFYLSSSLVALTFFIQSAMMTNTLYKISRWLDPHEKIVTR